jgi:hypothetical protein
MTPLKVNFFVDSPDKRGRGILAESGKKRQALSFPEPGCGAVGFVEPQSPPCAS